MLNIYTYLFLLSWITGTCISTSSRSCSAFIIVFLSPLWIACLLGIGVLVGYYLTKITEVPCLSMCRDAYTSGCVDLFRCQTVLSMGLTSFALGGMALALGLCLKALVPSAMRYSGERRSSGTFHYSDGQAANIQRGMEHILSCKFVLLTLACGCAIGISCVLLYRYWECYLVPG